MIVFTPILSKLFLHSETICFLHSIIDNRDFFNYQEVLSDNFALEQGDYQFEIDLDYYATMELSFWFEQRPKLSTLDDSGMLKKYDFDIEMRMYSKNNKIVGYSDRSFIPISTLNQESDFIVIKRFDIPLKCRWQNMLGNKLTLRLKINSVDPLLQSMRGQLIMKPQPLM